MSSEDLSSSSSIITPTAMQQRSHRLSRQSHVHHQVEIHDCIEDEEEEDEEEYIQPIVRRKDQPSITQSRSKAHSITLTASKKGAFLTSQSSCEV